MKFCETIKNLINTLVDTGESVTINAQSIIEHTGALPVATRTIIIDVAHKTPYQVLVVQLQGSDVSADDAVANIIGDPDFDKSGKITSDITSAVHFAMLSESLILPISNLYESFNNLGFVLAQREIGESPKCIKLIVEDYVDGSVVVVQILPT